MATGRKRKKQTACDPPAISGWKSQIESILRQVPGYNPWDLAPACEAWLDHKAAAHAINWFATNLRHVEGSARGEPFVLRPWQAAIVGNLFGWKRKDEKGRIVRRYRKCLLYIPRGQGKTPLASGIVAYAFFNDNEPGAQCFLAAGQREQAGILFRNLRGMIEQCPELLERVKIYSGDQHRSIILKDDPLAFAKVIPADAEGQHGGIPHLIAIDELHVQESRDLVEVFETAMAKMTRSQPLFVAMTTADYDRPSICNEIYAYAGRVRDNGGDAEKPGYDPHFLPVIYEAGEEDDWESEETWKKANPNIGVSVSAGSLRAAFNEARENPAKENAFRRLHLNQRTKQDVRLIPMAQWDACEDKALSLESLKGQPCWIGADLASREDLAALSAVFQLDDDRLAAFWWVFCPEEKVLWRARQKIPYDVWARAGWLEVTPGNSTDYAAIRSRLKELDGTHRIEQVYMDPFGARETATILMEDGFADRIVEFPQTMNNLSGPTKELLFRIKHGTFRHGANPVARWAAGNVAGYFKGTLPAGQSIVDALDRLPIMPSKQSSGDKIDPIAATINAIAAKQTNPIPQGRSVYETRGVLVL